MKALGDEIISLLSEAQENVLIVAPFMRSEALYRLLENIPVGIETTVVTRWRPTDLLSGASDLGVYDLVASKSASLFLRYDLHAKYFATDDKCLIGSANVTQTALGWRTPANFELLVPVARTTETIVEFENELLTGAVQATAIQRDLLEELLKKLRELTVVIPETDENKTTMGLLSPSWVPRVRNPEELYSVYCGNSDFSRSAYRTMQEDLAQFGAVPGMDEEGFRAWVASTISQTPLVARVIQNIDTNGQVTEAELSSLLAKIGVDEKVHHSRDVLEVLQRWLTYFFPIQYETARDSIKLIRATKL